MLNRRRGAGFSLVEMLVVIAILVILAGVVLPLLGGVTATAQVQTTQASLAAVRRSIMGDGSQPGYWGDLRKLPQTMADLFVLPASEQTFDRNTRHGWHGPYVSNSNGNFQADPTHGFTGNSDPVSYGNDGEPTLLDAWGHPIVIQTPTIPPPSSTEPLEQFVRVVSAGPDGILQTPADKAYPTSTERGDDVVIFLRRSDVMP